MRGVSDGVDVVLLPQPCLQLAIGRIPNPQLARLEKAGTRRPMTAGEVLFKIGVENNKMFIVMAGLLFAPVIHRFLHKFHLEDDPKGEDD